jgi:putative endonuclease
VIGERAGGKSTKKYGVTKLVWFQAFTFIEDAIQREKSMKRWPRAWKINLIERSNPDWHDLFPAMQKYDPKPPQSKARGEMGPRDAASGLRPEALPEDDNGG